MRKSRARKSTKKQGDEDKDIVNEAENGDEIEDPKEDDNDEEDEEESSGKKKKKGAGKKTKKAKGNKSKVETDESEDETKSKASKRKSTSTADSKGKKSKNESKEDDSDETDDQEYEVEKIIDVYFKKNGVKEFLVRWKGYASKDDTWEPESHLNCKDLINSYMAKCEKAKSVDRRETRVDRKKTNRYLVNSQEQGRKLSSRHKGKPRKTYNEDD